MILWAWERLSHSRPQKLLPRDPLPYAVPNEADAHVEVGPTDGFAPTPAHDPAPHVAAHDDLPTGPRGCSWDVA
ncbi:unnamed protein product [Ilex paraguariensis]|uniref:Uncharacterized protein n=1 Tax=Ilex paraguariensis TaxID=185542 RepID=A0ABC8TYZ7_9AQUA